jgi:hypothetical protein
VLAAVSHERISPNTFAAAPSGSSARAARSRKRSFGAKVTYTLNRAASVRFTVIQLLPGRSSKHSGCVKPTRKNRTARSCTRPVALGGSFTLVGHAGANSFHFTGRLAGHKLAPGRYQLVATPDNGGRVGGATRANFRIIQ